MNSNRKNTAVLVGSLLLGLVVTWAALGASPANETSLGAAMRTTAQLGLVLYLAIFVARPLQVLWVAPASRWLLRNRRLLGIAFAGQMLVHLALILWLFYGVNGEGLQLGANFVGAVAYGLVLALLITSWDRPARKLGARNWKRLHRTGLYWIGVPFLFTMVVGLAGESPPLRYYLFSTALLAAIAIRITAWYRLRARAAAHGRVPGA